MLTNQKKKSVVFLDSGVLFTEFSQTSSAYWHRRCDLQLFNCYASLHNHFCHPSLSFCTKAAAAATVFPQRTGVHKECAGRAGLLRVTGPFCLTNWWAHSCFFVLVSLLSFLFLCFCVILLLLTSKNSSPCKEMSLSLLLPQPNLHQGSWPSDFTPQLNHPLMLFIMCLTPPHVQVQYYLWDKVSTH